MEKREVSSPLMALSRGVLRAPCQEFGWLDTAGCEFGDQSPIRGQEIISTEFPGQNPCHLFERAGVELFFQNVRGKKGDGERTHTATIVVLDLRNRNGVQQSHCKFFYELTSQSLFERFAVLDLATGEFPF